MNVPCLLDSAYEKKISDQKRLHEKQLKIIIAQVETEKITLRTVIDKLGISPSRGRSIISHLRKNLYVQNCGFVTVCGTTYRLYEKYNGKRLTDCDDMHVTDEIKDGNSHGQRDWLQTAFFGAPK